MTQYRRALVAGGTYVFTVVTYRRQRLLTDAGPRPWLREAIHPTWADHTFDIDAWVLLPDHLHCIWTLQEGDADFSSRWVLIKSRSTRKAGGRLSREDWMHPFQTGLARMGGTGRRLAFFSLSPLCECRVVSKGLGRDAGMSSEASPQTDETWPGRSVGAALRRDRASFRWAAGRRCIAPRAALPRRFAGHKLDSPVKILGAQGTLDGLEGVE